MENVNELKKTGKMNVPGVVFASAKLFEDMKKDKTLEQVKNVACLPGIVEKSIAMPDAHQGYGFPVGGVAAFDLKKGIVSPGGIGYDINCLTGDAEVLTEFGGKMKIKDFEGIKEEIEIEDNGRKVKKIVFNRGIVSFNNNDKKFEEKNINFFMSREAEEICELELNSGLKVSATKEHPFLTKSGMSQLGDLKKGDKVAVNLFEGVEMSGNADFQQAIFAKVFGYMLGDGTFYKSKNKLFGAVYGNLSDLECLKKDLTRLGVSSSIYSRKRKHNIKTQYGLKSFDATNHELHVHSQEFLRKLEDFEMPLGNKTRQEIRIPRWVKESSKLIKRLFLAGFFGAEMSTPKTSSKTCFYCAVVDQNKIFGLSQSGRDFLIDLMLLLEEFDINNVRVTQMDDYQNRYEEKTVRLRLIISGEEDLLKLWRTIGFEYNYKRQQMANISALYVMLKQKENLKRIKLAERIKDYKKNGLGLGEVQSILRGEINARFVERHYYENAGQRISLEFMSFKDFCADKLDEIRGFGVIFDEIKEIRIKNERVLVYDFNIQDNHNFVANGFVVSNCGVRLLQSNLTKEEFMKKRPEVLNQLYRDVPSGVGKESELKLDDKELNEVLETGSKWALKKGFASRADLEHTEDGGCIAGADSSKVTPRAKARVRRQLGTLGAGNHFLEIQVVDEIFDSNAAKVFGLSVGQVVVLIHTGSRGLGHQTASDYIMKMEKEFGFKDLPDRELACAPISSQLGKDYLSAMAAAANFAFANRQIISYWIRESFKRYFPSAKLEVVYDVAHNIAKFEEFDGKVYCVHRKGATRSFGIGRLEIPADYRKVGQPVLIPGSMGTYSYVLVGTRKAEEISWGSTAHGAGRVMSRTRAKKELSAEKVARELEEHGVLIRAGSMRGILDEAPAAYKDVDEVVRVSDELGIGKLVAKLKPVAVMKG